MNKQPSLRSVVIENIRDERLTYAEMWDSLAYRSIEGRTMAAVVNALYEVAIAISKETGEVTLGDS